MLNCSNRSQSYWLRAVAMSLLFLGATDGDGPRLRATEPTPAKPAAVVPLTAYTPLSLSFDGAVVATGDLGLFDIATGRKLCTAEATGRCRHIAFAPDGRRLLSAHEGGIIGEPRLYIYLWDVTSENNLRLAATLLARKSGPNDFFTGLYHAAFSPDGRTVVAGSPDGTVYCWECTTAKERLRFPGVVAAAFAPDGRTLLVVGHDGLLRRFDAASGKAQSPISSLTRSDFIFTEGVAFAANCARVTVWDAFNLLLLDGASGKRISRLVFPNGCAGVGLSPDARMLLVAEANWGNVPHDHRRLRASSRPVDAHSEKFRRLRRP